MPYKWPLALDVLTKGWQARKQRKLLAMFDQYFDALGPTVQVSILAGKGYATMDPDNIETILSTRFEDFHLGPRNAAMKAMIGEGIFTQDDQAWKHSRDLLRGNFARMRYQNLEGFREHVENLVFTPKPRAPGIIDLQPLLFRLTLNTTIAVVLGQPIDSFNHEVDDGFSEAFDKASLVTATRVKLGDLWFLYAPRGFFQACKTVKDYTEQFVQAALRSDTSQQDKDSDTLLSVMKREYSNIELVRDQVTNVLIAGRDTTATTMSYAFRLLIRHPEKLQKLRAEVEEILGDDTTSTRARTQRMPYFHNVIQETLRLYPPVPINTRFCRRTTHLPRGGGPDGQSPLLVRENMPVVYSVYHMQRRTDIYGEDALCFRPERWEGPELANIKWAYLPFNGGPRVCLGKDFGLMLASYVIARVVQAVLMIELPPGEVVEPIGTEKQHLTLILSNADGCKVKLG
ncbi:Cytochrome P450 52A11 [Cercospora beticola]|uniref:Cytochrome P450 52A11 n=1 Tax=Cercospora beticola TaxID=122368 RepID=A0A2G5HEH1_CERBT|nr:Cytochrome P450 52A11 [Cercospora beticola]PIA90905.1 Cytochrome P450 52A11 [Cercospora beticola]